MYRAGTLAMLSGLTELGIDCWRRSLEARPDHLKEISHQLRGKMELPEQLEKVFPESPEVLLELARDGDGTPESLTYRATIAEKAISILDRTPEARRTALDWFHLGTAQELLGKSEESISSFSHSVKLDPKKADRRLRLIDALLKSGRVDEAIEQAEIGSVLPQQRKTFSVIAKSLANNRRRGFSKSHNSESR
ncbi:MAG: hypothetical protein FJ267_02550 [Planctomycetes bacterium]|nr:hypothetical protein [Planctomycetota bacterium]